MSAGSLSRRYAKALLSIGRDGDAQQMETISSELQQLADVIGSHEGLRHTLGHPSYALSKRQAVMQQLLDRLKLSPLMANFAMLMVDRRRAAIIPDVNRVYQDLADEQAGRVRADVKSAHALDQTSLDEWKKTLEQLTGKKVLMTADVDADLIAGTVTKIGSVVYDGSVRTRLELMRENLLQGKI